jgi:hypothetical protein
MQEPSGPAVLTEWYENVNRGAGPWLHDSAYTWNWCRGQYTSPVTLGASVALRLLTASSACHPNSGVTSIRWNGCTLATICTGVTLFGQPATGQVNVMVAVIGTLLLSSCAQRSSTLPIARAPKIFRSLSNLPIRHYHAALYNSLHCRPVYFSR